MRIGGEGTEITQNMIKTSIKRGSENRKACRDRDHNSAKIPALRIDRVRKNK